ncbi:hypothetical protein D3C71_1683100 [compost metagenome]
MSSCFSASTWGSDAAYNNVAGARLLKQTIALNVKDRCMGKPSLLTTSGETERRSESESAKTFKLIQITVHRTG